MKPHAFPPGLFTAAFLLFFPVAVQAQSELAAEHLTIQQSARFGTLIDDTGGAGFTLDVLQTQYETEIMVTVTPAAHTTTEYQEIWDWVDMGSQQEVWGTHSVEYYQPPTYDEDGNVLDPGGPYWLDEPYLISNDWVSDWQYAVVGHDYFQVTITPEPYEEVQYITNYTHPVVRFTGSRSNTEWLWRNPDAPGYHRPLMKLGAPGLSFPLPFEGGDHERVSLLNYYQVLYSKSNLAADDPQRESRGSRVTEEGVTVWHDESGAPGAESRLQNPAWSAEVRIQPSTLEIQRRQPASEGEASVITALSADFATFGGGASFAREVSFHGAVRIQPRGDLGMGPFTEGPQP